MESDSPAASFPYSFKAQQEAPESYSFNETYMKSSRSKRAPADSYETEQTFSEAELEDMFIEYVEDGELRAECKFCEETFDVDGNLYRSKSVKNHACSGNQFIKFECNEMGSEEFESGKFKRGKGTVKMKDIRKALIYMIIVDGLPFRHVDKPGFRHFMEVACPYFHIPSHITIARECMKLYCSEREKLKEMFKTCQRFSMTTDIWTSMRGIDYLCLTAHFIDNDWKLHKKIINFCPISSYKRKAVGKGVEICLKSWGIEDKLFTITVDNASSNDVACAHLSNMVKRTGCVSDGKNIHIRCIAHIINLIVWDVIEEHSVCIDRVRNAVKYVKLSPARILRFKDLVQKANMDCKAFLSLDVPTHWNYTYIMLETALKFQHVFSEISLIDGEDLNDNERLPDSNDWKNVERLVLVLKEFYILTKRISGSQYVTSNNGLLNIGAMFDMLHKWERSADLNLQAMAFEMKKKFDKYWGNVEKMNKLIYVACILDPHFKLVMVELILIDMHGKEKGMKLANDVKDFAYSLFDEYKNMYSPTSQSGHKGKSMLIDIDDDSTIKGGDAFMKKMKEKANRLKGTSGYVTSELDRFLNAHVGVEEEKQDALTWWSINGYRYPVLSRMARDLLAMPLSSIASESAFSTKGHALDLFQSSLTPMIIQALICARSWLTEKEVPILDVEESLKDLEEMENDAHCYGEDDEVVFVDSMV